MISKKKHTKKFLALLLAFVLVLTTIPIGVFTVFAANGKFTIVVANSKDASKTIADSKITMSAACGNDTVLSESTFTSDNNGKIEIDEISDYLASNSNATVVLTYSATADNYQSLTEQTAEITAQNVADDFNLALTPNPTVTVSGGADGTQLLVDGNEIESGSQVEVGTQVTLVVAEKENYTATVSPQAESVDKNNYTYTVTEDLDIQIKYTAITYTVKVNVGKNGKVNPLNEDGTVTVVKTNEKTTLEIIPDTGYYVSKVTFDKEEYDFEQSDDIKEYPIDNSKVNDYKSEVSVEFSIKTFSVTKDYVKPNQKEEGRGSIDIKDSSGKTLDDNDLTNVEYGTELTAVFTPSVNLKDNISYSLVNITNNGNSVSEKDISKADGVVTYKFEVTGKTDILADFSKVTILDLNIDDIVNVTNVKYINNGVYYVKAGNKSTIKLKDKITYTDDSGKEVTIKTAGITGYVDVNSHKVVFTDTDSTNTIRLKNSDTITRIQFQNGSEWKSDTYQVNGDITVIFDGKEPTIKFPPKEEEYENTKRTITFTAEDPTESYNGSDYTSGIKSVTVSYENGEEKQQIKDCTDNGDGSYSFEYDPAEFADCTKDIVYTVTATDNVGNSATGTYTVKNDTTAPVLYGQDAVTFEQNNTSVFAHILNKISRGKWCNSSIEVTVKATDDGGAGFGNGSSIAQIALVEEDGNVFVTDSAKFNKSGEAKITLKNVNSESKFKGSVYYNISDKLGNGYKEYNAETIKSDWQLLTTKNTEFEENDGYVVMIEENKPVISEITPSSLNENGRNSGNIYSGDIKFDFSITDDYSGIYGYCVTINDTVVLEKSALYGGTDDNKTEILDTGNLTVNTGQDGVTANSDGSYNIKVTATDYSGNVANVDDEKLLTVYKDTTTATISGFEFSLKDNIDVTGKDNIYEAVDVTDYGFYFKNKVTVTISASDIKSDKQIASGVKSITYKAVDINGNIEYSGEKPVDSNNQISFEIDKDFKGQIYAYATDNVDNSPLNSTLPANDRYDSSVVLSSGDYKGFVHPNSAILETPEKHEDSSINFTVPKAQGTQNNTLSSWTYGGKANQKDKKMDYNVSAQVPLYDSTQAFVVDVKDEYSGIREVKYSLIEGEKTTSHTLTVDNTKSINGLNSGDIATGNDTANSSEKWNVVSEATATESNLVTAIKSTVTVDGNYNDMVLLVELVDRAGNSSYDYIAFGIDQTPTAISVSYDNNNADTKSGNGAFFNANRTATVTVKERNFNTENIEWTIRNAEGAAPSHSAPKFTQGSGNRDDDTYVYTVTYSNDGIYSFDMKYTDRAGNKNQSIDYGNSVAPTKFVVDKTLPVINVSYDNNDARNEKYFNAYRTATVTVTEHNFDVNRVTIKGTASLDGNAVKFPDASWSNSGDTHVATIKYDTDADYTFDISMDDMAGNKSNEANYGSSVAPKDFVVDTTIDKPVISGVENGNSYKDSVLPKIDFSDINFKDVKVTLLRTRKDEVNKDVTSDYINVSTNDKGGSFAATEDTFKKIQENDGIYTLSVQITDKAENTSSDEVTFTVNRFGSVYSLGAYLSNDLNNKYVQSIDNDIVITEYNPDRLVEGNLDVVVTRDGSPVEYGDGELTISPVVKELAKIGSSGWYQYEYTISKNVFTDDNGNPIDGIYKVYVGSEDTAGNKSENISYDESSVLFRLDHTAPTIKSVSGLNKKIVNADEQKVSYEVFDAIGIDSIDVYYYDGNGTRVDHIRSTDKGSADVTDILSDLTNYTGSFTIGSSTTSEPVRIVIKDLAGNVTDTDSKDFDVDSIDFNRAITVSTNFFVRWFANKIVFGCSIAAIIAVGGGLAFFIAIRKRRKDEAITEEIKKKARGSKD